MNPIKPIKKFLAQRRAKTWIQTYSKKRFEPMNPDPSLINVIDIAHHLSNICRYTGAVADFYSVAEHSVRASWVAEELARVRAVGSVCSRSEQEVMNIARGALFHDATEAYMNDVARPVKVGWSFFWYRHKERALQRMIFTKYGLNPDMHAIVYEVDNLMLFTEALSPRLMAPLHPDWPIGPHLSDPIDPWDSKKAEHMFLVRYAELWPDVALGKVKNEAQG